MSNNFKTKIRLSDNKVYQNEGDILSLSGDTSITEVGNLFINDNDNHFAEDGVTNVLDTLKSVRQNTTKYISQNSHNFNVGNVVGFNPQTLSFEKVKAENIITNNIRYVGIVSRVTSNNNNFVLTLSGVISNLTGLVVGNVYYIDNTTAGLLTNISDKSINNYPILVAKTTSTGVVLPFIGYSENNSITKVIVGDNNNDTFVIPNPYPSNETLNVRLLLYDYNNPDPPTTYNLIPVEVAWKHVKTEVVDDIVIEFDYKLPNNETYYVIINK